jgi:hypothetical protein
MTKQRANAQRVQRRRDKLRAAGLRPVQIWIPDTRAPGFAAEAERQSRLIAATEGDAHEAWYSAADEVEGWTA